jgi:hypothetical protein
MTAFEQVGRAYLAFARAEPAYYSAMFEAGLPMDLDPALREAGDRAFAVLRKASETLCGLLPPGRRPPALMMALHVWALSHGIASLFGRGDAAGVSCRWRPRSSWRPACWSISPASDSPAPRPPQLADGESSKAS